MCVLLVSLTWVYHDARFRECKKKKNILSVLTRCLQRSRPMLENQLFLQPQLASRKEQCPIRKYQSRREGVIVPRSLHKLSAVFTRIWSKSKIYRHILVQIQNMEFRDNPSGGCCSAPCGTVITVDVMQLLTAFCSYIAKEPKMRPRLHSVLWLPVISKNTFSVFGTGQRFFSLFTAPRSTPLIAWLRNQWISGDLYPIFA